MQTPNYVQYPRYRQADISVSLIGDAWEYIKNNFGVYVGFTALIVIPGLVLSFIIQGPAVFMPDMDNPYRAYSMPNYWIGQGISFLFNAFMVAGVTRIALKELGGQRATLSDGFSVLANGFIPAFIAWFLTTILTMMGAVFLLLPGIAIAVLLMATTPAILDQKLSVVDAMGWSFQNAKNHFWQILGVMLLGGILIFLGMCMCYIGFFVTMPLYVVLTTMIYHQLRWEETGGLAEPMNPATGAYPQHAADRPTPADMAPPVIDPADEPRREEPPPQ